MTPTLDHPLVQDYLARLRAHAVRLPPGDARELETQIREHLGDALADDASEADVRQVLDRLGEPAELVDAAGAEAVGAHAPGAGGAPSPSSPWREVLALVGLVGSGLLFWLLPVNLVLWVGGLVMLLLARRWSPGEKVLGGLVLGLSWWLPLLAFGTAVTTTVQSCSTDAAGVEVCTGDDGGLTTLNVVVIALTVVWVVLYLWTVVRLARSAARDR